MPSPERRVPGRDQTLRTSQFRAARRVLYLMSRGIMPDKCLDEEEAMLKRMIVVTVPAERAAEAERLWKQGCAPLMIQQPGCLSEEFLRNSKDPGQIISLQTWENQGAIDRYRKSPAHEEILRHTRGLMGVSKVEVATYEVIG